MLAQRDIPDAMSNRLSDTSPDKDPADQTRKPVENISKIPKRSGSSPITFAAKSEESHSKIPKKTESSPRISNGKKVSTGNASKIPKRSDSAQSLQSPKHEADKNTSLINQQPEPVGKKLSDITPKKSIAKKLPWQQDASSDDSESEVGAT